MNHLYEYNEFKSKTIHVNDFANLVAQKFEYVNATYLTSGTYGVIYNINNENGVGDRIMKITSSIKEIQASMRVGKSYFDNVANVYGNFKLKTDYRIEGTGIYLNNKQLYVIFVEKLYDLKKAEDIALTIYSCLDETVLPDTLIQNASKYRNDFVSKLQNLSEKDLNGNTVDEIIKCYDDIIKMNKQLSMIDVKSGDANIRNFGFKKNGNFAIFDIQDKRKLNDKINHIVEIR